MSTEGCLQNTYKGLKLQLEWAKHVHNYSLQNTYKGLKRESTERQRDESISLQNTYKGLKLSPYGNRLQGYQKFVEYL